MEGRTHSVGPETDDFGARYDRMVRGGPMVLALKTVLVLVAILTVVGLLKLLAVS